MRRRAFHEIPPTAGLPLGLADLLGQRAALGETLAAQLGTPPLQLECSGTAALLVALRTLSEQAPDRRTVVVPAYTCPLVAIAVRSLGLELRLCDLRANHFDMDPQALTQACRGDILAVVPTHLAGLIADVDTAMEIAKPAGAWVIEDAAQALGARTHGHSVGLRGDIGFFSLAAGKGLSIYEGGLLLTRDASMRDALRRTHEAMVPERPAWELRRSLELVGLAALYRPSGLGLAYGMPLRRALRRGDPVAAIGEDFPPTIPLHKVSRWRESVGTRAAARLPNFIKQLRRQASGRVERLRQIRDLEVFDPGAGNEGSWPFLLLRLPNQRSRDSILSPLWTAGVGVSRLFIHALPDYSYLANRISPAPTPNARSFAEQTLTISNSPWLDDATFEKICHVIERCLN